MLSVRCPKAKVLLQTNKFALPTNFLSLHPSGQAALWESLELAEACLICSWCDASAHQPRHTDRLHRDTGRTHGGSAATVAATSGCEVFGEEYRTMQQHKYNVTVVNGGSDGTETAILEV